MLHARTCLLCFAETFLPAAPIFCSALPFTFRLLKNLSMVARAKVRWMVGGRCCPLEWRHWIVAEVSPPPSSLHCRLGRTGWLGPAAATDSTWRLVLVARRCGRHTGSAAQAGSSCAPPLLSLSRHQGNRPAPLLWLHTLLSPGLPALQPGPPMISYLLTYSVQIIQNSMNSELSTHPISGQQQHY